MKDIHGTSYYIAPDVLAKKGYNERCDVWSLGVILFILLTGKPPFDGDGDEEITDQVKIGNISYADPVWDNISSDAKDLLKNKMLQYNIKLRESARQCLAHPWFKNAPTHAIDDNIMKEALSNLKSFQATEKLQQATMSMMVQNMIQKEETARL